MIVKKILIILFFFSFQSSLILAQFSKGDLLLDGTIYANKNEYESLITFNGESNVSVSSNSNLVINPRLHYFVLDNLSISAGIGYKVFVQKGEQFIAETASFNEIENKTELYLISTSATIYQPLTKKFLFHSEFNSIFAFGENKPELQNFRLIESDVFELELNIKTGLSYFLSDRILLSASIRPVYFELNNQKSKSLDVNLTRTNSGIELSSSLTFGFAFKL
ncbi:MAG: hypothetical protein BalsKO_02080 [Balneolaceae bacterium]